MTRRFLRFGRRTSFALRRKTATLTTAIVLALLGNPALGHTRSISYSSWDLDPSGATLRVRISRIDLTRLGLDPVGSYEDSLTVGRYLADRLQLRTASGLCPATRPPVPLRAPTGYAVYSWRVECPEAAAGPLDNGVRVIRSSLLLAVAPSHLHFVRLELPDESVLDHVLSAAAPSRELSVLGAKAATAPPPSGSASVTDYLTIGGVHILSGWDHLAFVFALLLLAGSLRELAFLVTSFTVAHSVTLGLATLRIVQPEGAAVEAMIGYSIALVAAENAWLLGRRTLSIPAALCTGLAATAVFGGNVVTSGASLGLALFSMCHFGMLKRSPRPANLRAAVAFAFGLVHGFGFAGVLGELSLPTQRMVPALFGFNLGVELGQLAVVAVAWPLLRALARAGGERWEKAIAELGSAAICALGVFWFVTRSLSG